MSTFPNFPEKQGERALFEPEAYIEYMRKRGRMPTVQLPETVIFCYTPRVFDKILQNHKHIRSDGFLSRNLILLEETAGRVGVFGHFGVGAPVTTIWLEELIACGVQNYISIGSAGSIQKDLRAGELVLCDRAVRDEGVSHHYLPAGKYAEASGGMTGKIKSVLERKGILFRQGASWTTDAVYRETVAEVQQYQKEGVLTVEMEMSALFAVAQYRKIEMGALFVVSDELGDLKWNPEFHSMGVDSGFDRIFEVALAAVYQSVPPVHLLK